MTQSYPGIPSTPLAEEVGVEAGKSPNLPKVEGNGKSRTPISFGCIIAFGVVVGLLWSVLVVGYFVWVYGANEVVVRDKYFEVAAQVIPVLLLAAALERHYFDVGNRADPLTKAYNIIVLIWLVAGEAAAMVVVMNGTVTAVAFGLTTNALCIAAILVILLAVGGPWTPRT